MEPINHSEIRAIVVDDHFQLRHELAEFLEINSKLKIIGLASNGEEALHLSNSLKPDLVLLDQNMPECDGIEACKNIKNSNPDQTILILYNFNDLDRKVDAFNAGASFYLSKENIPVLLTTINNIKF